MTRKKEIEIVVEHSTDGILVKLNEIELIFDIQDAYDFGKLLIKKAQEKQGLN